MFSDDLFSLLGTNQDNGKHNSNAAEVKTDLLSKPPNMPWKEATFPVLAGMEDSKDQVKTGSRVYALLSNPNSGSTTAAFEESTATSNNGGSKASTKSSGGVNNPFSVPDKSHSGIKASKSNGTVNNPFSSTDESYSKTKASKKSNGTVSNPYSALDEYYSGTKATKNSKGTVNNPFSTPDESYSDTKASKTSNDSVNNPFSTPEESASSSWIEQDAQSWVAVSTTTTPTAVGIGSGGTMQRESGHEKAASTPTTSSYQLPSDEAMVAALSNAKQFYRDEDDETGSKPSGIEAKEEEEAEDDVEFLLRTKEQVAEWIRNAYRQESTKSQTSEGNLETSLCEDVYGIVQVHVESLMERFLEEDEAGDGDGSSSPSASGTINDDETDKDTKQPDEDAKSQPEEKDKILLVAQGVVALLQRLEETQIIHREQVLATLGTTGEEEDLEACCAAANDFLRMSDTLEEIILGIVQERLLQGGENDPNTGESSEAQVSVVAALEEHAGILLRLYNRHAVFCAQQVHISIINTIQGAISKDLFGNAWLHELTSNELAVTMVRTLDDFWDDLQVFLDPVLVSKCLESLVSSTVIFYAKTLVQQSGEHLDSKKSIWKLDNQRGLDRMAGDMKILKDYFEELARNKDSSASSSSYYPALSRVIEGEFEVLGAIHEILSIATGFSGSNLCDFVLVLHKRLQNVTLTKYVVGDLIHIVNPEAEKDAYHLVDSMNRVLTEMIASNSSASAGEAIPPGLSWSESLMAVASQSQRLRIRPGLSTDAIEQGEIMLSMWSRQSTKYRKKMARSIQKHSAEYSKNWNKSMASLSHASTSASKNMAENMSKAMSSFSVSSGSSHSKPNNNSKSSQYANSNKSMTTTSTPGTSTKKSMTKSMSKAMSSFAGSSKRNKSKSRASRDQKESSSNSSNIQARLSKYKHSSASTRASF